MAPTAPLSFPLLFSDPTTLQEGKPWGNELFWLYMLLLKDMSCGTTNPEIQLPKIQVRFYHFLFIFMHSSLQFKGLNLVEIS